MPDFAEYYRRYDEMHPETEGIWSEHSECVQGLSLTGAETVTPNWAEISSFLMDKFQEQLSQNWYQLARIEGLEKEILLLKNRCDYLEKSAPIIVPIESFSPEPYEILKPFHVVVKFYDGQYIASFFDANLGASGDTQEEAVFNLKDMLIETFEILNELEDDKLGTGPQQQKAVLKEFLARRRNDGNNKRVS